MADRKRVNLTVSPAQKEKWDNAVDESPEYSSLSGLIRTAVAHELSDSGDAATAPTGRTTEQTEAQTQALEKVTDTLNNIENTLSDLDDRLTGVEREVTAAGKAELKNDIIDALPEIHSDNGPTGKSAEEIAQEIKADRERVSSVLTRMVRETSLVEIAENIKGQNFYAKEAEY